MGMEQATKENLKKLSNLPFYPEDPQISAKITGKERQMLLQGVFENDNLLRTKIRDICQLRAAKAGVKNVFFYVANECDVSESNFRKIVNARRKVTPDFLGRFCVGMKLSLEDSAELFSLIGYKLEFGTSYLLSITMCALRDGDNIEDYVNDLRKYKDETIL